MSTHGKEYEKRNLLCLPAFFPHEVQFKEWPCVLATQPPTPPKKYTVSNNVAFGFIVCVVID